MRPAARIQAAMALTAALETAARENGAASDEVVRRFFRERRYAGSKDRRAVTAFSYDAVRNAAQDNWRLGEHASYACRLALRLHLAGEDWRALFKGEEPHGPAPLTDTEIAAVETAATTDLATAPPPVRYGFPEFLTDSLRQRFGDRLDAEMTALGQRPTLDLRVNSLKSTVDKALQAFEKNEITAERTPYSPVGLRVAAGTPVTDMDLFGTGRIEIQNEGSQLAVLACAVHPGQQVIDLCAGGGGKTLALAAMMQNKGQIYAFDKDPRRLRPLNDRLRRAGVRNVQSLLLDADGERRLAELEGCADVVLVDSPCGGSGTWGRDPALPWRLTPERLRVLGERQLGLLRNARPLIKPGGRLVYVTCSILPEENERVIEEFLCEDSSLALCDYRDILGEAGIETMPKTLSDNPACLQLSPGSHGTDGFFVAVLQLPD